MRLHRSSRIAAVLTSLMATVILAPWLIQNVLGATNCGNCTPMGPSPNTCVQQLPNPCLSKFNGCFSYRDPSCGVNSPYTKAIPVNGGTWYGCISTTDGNLSCGYQLTKCAVFQKYSDSNCTRPYGSQINYNTCGAYGNSCQ